MLGMVSTWNKDEHTRMGGEIGAFIGRLAKRSRRDLFVMRYEKLGVFCICEFLSPKHDVFVDTMNLGKSLANFDRAKRIELEHRLFRPIDCAETSQFIAETESDYHHERQDWNAEETERLEKCAQGE
jgi:hypothetical protein